MLRPVPRAAAGALITAAVAGGAILVAAHRAAATSAHTNATLVEKLTGPDSPNDTYGRWNVKATDLGIMWDDNAGGVLTAFGDTFGDAWIGPGYLYVYGTPSGRNGSLYLARTPETQILTQAAYQYWNGSTWVTGNESAATAVVGAPVSELSVRYDGYSGHWLMMYLRGEDIILRTAAGPQGPWSAAQVVVSSADYPGLYGGFMHPWSSGGTIYFTMSQWDPYNVYLMKVRIDSSGTVVDPNLMGDPSFERGALNSSGTGGFWACGGNCWQDVHQTVPVAAGTGYQLTGFVRTSANSDNGFMGARTTGGVVRDTTASGGGTPVGVPPHPHLMPEMRTPLTMYRWKISSSTMVGMDARVEPAMSRPQSLPRSDRKLPRNCMICVRFGSVMVRIGHTYAFQYARYDAMPTTTNGAADWGRNTRRKICHRLAPSIIAASSTAIG